MEYSHETVSLIKQYQKSHDITLLDRIIEINTGLVKSIAAKFSWCGESYDDLAQCGYIGLINTINNFNEKKGTRFSTYATRMIEGEIRHHLRDNLLLKVPRWIRALSAQIDRSIEQQTRKLGRLPKVSEIADDSNITEDGIMEVLKARESRLLRTLDDLEDSDYDVHDLSPDVIKGREMRSFQLPVEDRILLYDAMDALSVIEKKVIYFVFYKDLTETEAGEHLEIGQRKVSRVLVKAIAKLRKLLAEEL